MERQECGAGIRLRRKARTRRPRTHLTTYVTLIDIESPVLDNETSVENCNRLGNSSVQLSCIVSIFCEVKHSIIKSVVVFRNNVVHVTV